MSPACATGVCRPRSNAFAAGPTIWAPRPGSSLVAPGEAKRLEGVFELGVRALVTNRELAENLRVGGTTDFRLSGAPVKAATIVRATPTKPRPPMGISDGAWRVIGHPTPNYAAFALDNDDDPAVLRDHLALYGRTD
ncbi:type VI secretion system baseplate subunit TssF [Caulobacter segnis]